jgi:hypothetical protein
MKKEFVPYEPSFRMKAIGFDEPCLKSYGTDGLLNENDHEMYLSAPLFQQAFRWFREKYKLHTEIRSYTAKYFTIIIQECKDIVRYIEYGGIDLKFNTYEEAELACLEKLIEIVEKELNKSE